MIKGIIFDADGTLLDSMMAWRVSTEKYLSRFGCALTEEQYKEIFTLSLEQATDYLKERFPICDPPEKIKSDYLEIIKDFYFCEVKAKEGVCDFLERLYKNSIPMIIATSGDRILLDAAFNRLGIRKYFIDLLNCTELKTDKQKPDIYLKAAEMLGTPIENTAVFEDVLHAVKTAKAAGFYVVGVEDAESKPNRDAIMRLSDRYITTYNGFEL
ncbi:MAG: HAD family phosphatase [Clostridia bacterium]|nr:HAD family phosphatase [Clostridia bacterium]